MSSKNFTARKVPILGAAMTILAAGSEHVVSGQYIEGGMLMLSGFAMVALYEIYQIQQLPEPIDPAHIEDAADRITDEVKRKTQLDEFLGGDVAQSDESGADSSDGMEMSDGSQDQSQSSQDGSDDTSGSSGQSDGDTESVDTSKQDISAAEV